MKDIFLIFFVALFIVAIVAGLVALVNFNNSLPTTEALPSPKGITYELFYIEGMPCMRIGRALPSGGAWNYDGVTCDWSKWNGGKK